jgi:hypothetical protein
MVTSIKEAVRQTVALTIFTGLQEDNYYTE